MWPLNFSNSRLDTLRSQICIVVCIVKAQTLRLLAHVYVETGTQENLVKSLEAVELANACVCVPAGLHLRYRPLYLLLMYFCVPNTRGCLLHAVSARCRY